MLHSTISTWAPLPRCGCRRQPLGPIVVLKPLYYLADYLYVQRSTVFTGILLAASGALLAGVGYWVSGGFDYFAGSPDIPTRASGPSRSDDVRSTPGGGTRESVPAGVPEYTISKNVPEVRLQFTVADERGRLIPDVARSDIRILDDQVPVEHIQQFDKIADLPLRIGLLLDVSDSMKRAMEQEKSVALGFLNRVVRTGKDRAFVMAFGEGIQIWQDPTTEAASLIGAVKDAKGPGDSTDFYDAVYYACVNQWKAQESDPVHRVMVVISDGEDTGSRHGLNDVIAVAQRSEIQIYALNVHLKKRSYRGDGVLQTLAYETGGHFFVANNAREADMIFSQLEEEMRTQYYVSFRPKNEVPGYHALQVEMHNPKLMVHARRGYYAVNQ